MFCTFRIFPACYRYFVDSHDSAVPKSRSLREFLNRIGNSEIDQFRYVAGWVGELSIGRLSTWVSGLKRINTCQERKECGLSEIAVERSSCN